jgi:hypothetical protein
MVVGHCGQTIPTATQLVATASKPEPVTATTLNHNMEDKIAPKRILKLWDAQCLSVHVINFS